MKLFGKYFTDFPILFHNTDATYTGTVEYFTFLLPVFIIKIDDITDISRMHTIEKLPFFLKPWQTKV